MGSDRGRPWSSLPHTAVFIDGDWLVHAARRLEQPVDFAELLQSLRNSFGVSAEVRIYLSVSPGNASHAGFVNSLQRLGYQTSTASMVQHGGRTFSKGLDIRLATDAAGLSREVDRLVLVSGDNDFVPLLRAAHEHRRSSVLITLPLVAGRALTEAADYLATVEDLIRAAKPTPGQSAAGRALLPQAALPRESYIEKGSHIDSYLLVRRILTAARRSLTIIDSYVDDQLLLLLSTLESTVRVVILTDRIQPPDFPNIVRKLRREGRHIEIYRTREFHDRFIQVDDQWWHSGHSLKDLGSRDSRITKVADQHSLEKLQKRVAEAMKTATYLCPTGT